MSNNQPNQWILDPVANAVRFLAEEHALASVIERSLITMAGFPTFIDLAATNPLIGDLDPMMKAQICDLRSRAKDDARFIEQAAERHFERVYAHHFVAIWAATETCIETTLQNCYLHIDHAQEIAHAHGFGSAKPAASPWKARNAIRNWRREIKNPAELKKDEELFRAFGIKVSFTPEDAEHANEISGIRNCLVHDRGIAGLRLFRKCSRLQTRWHEGEEIRLGRPDCENAYDVCGRILQSIINGIIASDHLRYSRPEQ